ALFSFCSGQDDELKGAHRMASSGNLQAYINAVVATFTPTVVVKIQEALRKIGDPPLQLLALRRYIRIAARKDLEAHWTWSDAEIVQYQRTEIGQRVDAAIHKVNDRFKEMNPGYTLVASPPRSLDRQVSMWKRVKVRDAASGLWDKCLREVATTAYPDVPTR